MGEAKILGLVSRGPEGARYAAVTPEGRAVVLHVLSAELDPERIAELKTRVELVRALSGPELLPVLDARLEGDRRVIVVATDGLPTIAERLAEGALPREIAASYALGLLRSLRRAHRLGLAHGAIRASELRVREDGQIALDLLGVQSGPEHDEHPSTEADAAAAAALVQELLDVGVLPRDGREVLSAMGDPDPQARPPLALAFRVLSPALLKTATVVEERPRAPEPGELLGRYRLLERLGKGANGEVFKAEMLGNGAGVAIKVLRPEAALDPTKLLRFRREARVLGELSHPNIANLIEVNEDRGVVFIATELVEGATLETYRRSKTRLPEREALLVSIELARALVSAHARGIVHRDIKPENIMLGPKLDPAHELAYSVRLCDFGIAHWDGDDDSLTGMMALGTPRFMAPEQCTAVGDITPATDVYAMGLVLFDLLTGSRPFAASGSREIMRAQVEDAPRRADEVSPGVSREVSDLIARCIAKEPAARPRDAAQFLEEAQAVLGGAQKPSLHPPLPEDAHRDVVEVAYQWSLKASPSALWRFVSDTDRLNRALGLPAVEWTFRPEDDEIALFGATRQVGLDVKWRERPYEWIEGQRLGVLREYSEGPITWYVSSVELHPGPDGGTLLTHRIWLKPRALAWKPVIWIEVKQRLKAQLDRLYRRLGEAATSPEPPRADAFEGAPKLSRTERRRLQTCVDELRRQGVTAGAAEALLDVMLNWSDQEVARIRPIPTARRYRVPEGELIEACLVGASIGLLLPVWDVLCPTCRVPTKVVDSLAAVRAHMDCEVCRESFEVDAASSIELVFRAHPDVRKAELRTYCLGGPSHSPHTAAQVWLKPGERFRFELRLEEGAYLLRSTKDAWRARFRATRGAARRVELTLRDGAYAPPLSTLGSGLVELVLENRCTGDRVVRLERAAFKGDAFTGAQAAAHPTFQRLFPQQTLAPETLVSIASVSLLVTDVHGAQALYDSRGDAAMLGALHRHLDTLTAKITAGGGSVVKAVGHGVLAVFPRVEDAVQTALHISSSSEGLPTITAVHRGPAMMATVGGRLDYFGRAVVRAHAMLGRAAAHQVIVSERVAEETAVERLWEAKGYASEIVTFSAELGVEMAVRLKPPAGAAPARATDRTRPTPRAATDPTLAPPPPSTSAES